MRLIGLVALVLMLAGCAGNAEVIKALANDPATICGSINTIYGTVNFARTNITQGDVKCNGLEVHSPGQTTVPVQVVPVPVK